MSDKENGRMNNGENEIGNEMKGDIPKDEKEQKRELSQFERNMINMIAIDLASNGFKGNKVKGDKETESKLISDFDSIYSRLQKSGERAVEIFMEDEACKYLVELCNWLACPPVLKSFINVYTVGSDVVASRPVICYPFHYSSRSIALNVLLFIMRMKDKLRLFAIETGANDTFVLCEYTGYSHRNYGTIRDNVIADLERILSLEEGE